MIADQIVRECAGNMHVSDHPFPPETIKRLLLKVVGPSKFNFLGLREPGMTALLSVPTSPCYVAAASQPFRCVEITRIECDERLRRSRLFLKFVEKLAITCSSMDMCLVMGCVESTRMLTLMRRHNDVWCRLASDPTSYVYVPSIDYNLKRCLGSSKS